MSENDITIWTHLMGTDAMMAEADMLDRRRDEIVKDWALTKAQIQQDLRTVQTGMRMSVGLARNILGAVGQSLGPIENAMLNTIQITVDSLVRIAAAWGTTGYGLAFTVAIGSAAIALSVWSTSAMVTGMRDARTQIDHAIGVTQDVYNMFHMFGG